MFGVFYRPPVHADFARQDQLLQPGAAQFDKFRGEETVEPLAGIVRARHRRFDRLTFFWHPDIR